MNAEALLKHYERIADAPDAVGRLRKFILDLAVRGKLVPQDESDEPAELLLKRFFQKPNLSSKDGQSESLNEGLWETPAEWRFISLARLSQPLGLFTDGDWVESKDQDPTGQVRITQLADVGVGEFRNRSARFMTIETARRLNCTFLEPGDILIARMPDPLGRACMFPGDAKPCVTVVDVAALRIGNLGIEPRFAVLAINSPKFSRNVAAKAAGTTRSRISRGNLAALPFPLPPLSEQKRIVAKVDELMALCDQLEAARAEREATRDRLAAASLARLNTPDPDPDTFKAHASFAISTALPALTTRTDQIKQLRQTILNLAVRGKLVLQSTTEIADNGGFSGPFELPRCWQWLPTQSLCTDIIDCPHSTAKFESSGIACIDTNSFKDGRLIESKLRFVSDDTFATRIARLAPISGDIVFAREGSVGESVIIPPGLRCCLGQRVMLFRPGPRVTSEFFQLAVSEPSSVSRLISLHKGIGAKHVNVKDMRATLIPVPPVEEQARIVAKVNELMQVCDQLEASLTQGANVRSRLLNAMLHEALLPLNEKVIDFAAARQRLHEGRESIACRVVQRLGPTRGFGRVRAMKPLYWAEAHCGAALGGQWGRAEAGPFDQWIFNFEAHAASTGWFSVTEHRNGDKVTKAEYRAGTGLSAKAAGAAEALGSAAPEFERVLSLLADLNTEDSEIVTTLYAAWNDLLLEGKPFSDAAVITDVREHWHPSKARFTPALLQTWLDWLRKNRLVPKGKGPNTRHQPELI